jgi:signal transduction histidine kinase/CheY-like chemotaxis protein
MKSAKLLRIPFLFISGITILLILFILYTRSQADNSITKLQKGSREAISVFKANKLLDEIFNQLYVAETMAANNPNAANTTDSLKLIERNIKELNQLFTDSVLSAQTKLFSSLVQKQLENTTTKRDLLSPVNAKDSALNESIFVAAVNLEEKLGLYLQANISGNEKLATRVLKLDMILTILIIIIIASLATIIIGYLLRNYKLIQAVEKQREEISHTAAIKEQFLANMSHEIRTPINSVIGFTNLLEKTRLDQNQSIYVGTIKTAGENLLTIVNDILDISKIEAGMLHFDKSPFSIQDVCYHVETLMYHKASEKGLEFFTDIDENIPEVVSGDKERLIQILMNLTSNAIKFTSSGKITIKVKCDQLTDKNAIITFLVADTGIGIPKNKLGSIFQRFEQAEADTTRKFGGTGLGLAIVKNLVEMQGGTIELESEEGAGSTFSFKLPFETNKQMELDILTNYNKNKIQSSPDNGKKLSGLSILAAEDNKMNQLLLKMIFEQWNVSCTIVDNGELAIEQLKNNKYDLVLMDIQMPILDGYSASRQIRNTLKSDIPVIAMTANVLPGEKEKCADAGMNGYISKPLNEAELFGLLSMYNNQLMINSKTTTENSINFNYINPGYLKQVFGTDPEFIKSFICEFKTQFHEEMNELSTAIKTKNAPKAQKLAHHMKTTVGVLHDQSPLLTNLAAIEFANDSETGWNIIHYNFDTFVANKEILMKEVELYSSSLN